jgi:hypothetical protein
MLNFEDYRDYYLKNGRCIDQIRKPNNRLTDSALQTKYKSYVRKEQKKLDKILNYSADSDWESVRAYVFERDGHKCRLWSILTTEEKDFFKECGGYLTKTLDPAHIIPRSISSNLYYIPENIITLDRIFHSRLDNQVCPLSGLPIKKEDIDDWWIRIVGKRIWEMLQLNK